MLLEDANSGNIICKPFLDISGDDNNTVTMDILSLIKDGYSRFDNIIKIKLSKSIYDSVDESYPILINSEYTIYNESNGDIFTLYLVDIYEESTKTILELYIKIQDYNKYFKNITTGDSLTNYTFIYGSNLEIAYTECQLKYDFNFTNLSNSGFNVKFVGKLIDDIEYFTIAYRKIGDVEWTYTLTNNKNYNISSLDTKTNYEVKCLIYCTYPYSYSFYSDIKICKTL